MNKHLEEVIEEVRNTRVVKVFLSSTFRDMQMERDKLLTDAFVRLREECSERGIIWNEIDLRWGVTQEQVDNFEVLPICFSEIENSLPFFVGILGNRYGWVPDENGEPEQLEQIAQKYDWLNTYKRRSVTELEFLHGAILNQNPHALFYFKDAKAAASLPEEIHLDAVENEEWRKTQLADLKRLIRNDFETQWQDYRTVEQLNELVYMQMKQKIDEFFPQDEVQNVNELEETKHLHFSKVRASFFVGREEYLEKMNGYVLEQGKKPLYIHGTSGVGKTTLLSNWYQSNAKRLKEDGYETIVHFIGATPNSYNPVWIGKQIIYALNKKFNLAISEPTNYSELKTLLSAAIEGASKAGKVVIAIDSIDQLVLQSELYGKIPDWLPVDLPNNVKLIVSTTSESSAKTYFDQQGWLELHLQAFKEREYKQFIENYLKLKYSKQLDQPTYEAIVKHSLVDNPLFLVTLLEEIRIYGKPDILDYTLQFLQVETIEELFIKRLERLEAIYQNDPLYSGSNLVKDALSLLWVSNNGLTEMELREILGGKTILKGVLWSKFYHSMGTNLVSNGGLTCLFHSYLRAAVAQKYDLENKKSQAYYRKKIASYFLNKKRSRKDYLRVSKELPYQLFSLNQWATLQEVLADYPLLQEVWADKPDTVRLYWNTIEQQTNPKFIKGQIHLTRLDTYKHLIENPSVYKVAYVEIVMQLLQLDYPTESYSLLTYLLNIYEGNENVHKQLELLAIKAKQTTIIASIEEALDDYTKLHELASQYEAPFYEQLSLVNLAKYYMDKLELDKALSYIDKQQKICEEHNLIIGLQKNYKLRANLAIKQGDVKTATHNLEKAYEICEALNMSDELQEYWGIKTALSRYMHDYKQALKDCSERQKICKQYGYTNELISCYLDWVGILQENKKNEKLSYVEITRLFTTASEEALKINNVYRQQQVRLSYLKTLINLTELEVAKKELDVYLETAHNRNNAREIALGMLLQMNIYRKNEQYKEALNACDEHYEYCLETNQRLSSFFSLKEKVEILISIGEMIQARELMQQCLERLPEIKHNKTVTRILKIAADIARYFGETEETKQHLVRMKEIAEAFNIHERSSQAVYELTRVYLDEGMSLYNNGMEAEAREKFEMAWSLISQPVKFSYNNINEIDNLKNKCWAVLNGDYSAYKSSFSERSELSEDEVIVLQSIAKLGIIVKKTLDEEVIANYPQFTAEKITDVNRLLANKKLIRYKKKASKNYFCITGLAKYRLEQLGGEIYEVPVIEDQEMVRRTWEEFQQDLKQFITFYDGATINDDEKILNVPVDGEMYRALMFLDDLTEFRERMDKELVVSNQIVILIPDKKGLDRNNYHNSIMAFYTWLKDKYGHISKVPAQLEVYLLFEYLLKHKHPLALRRLKY